MWCPGVSVANHAISVTAEEHRGEKFRAAGNFDGAEDVYAAIPSTNTSTYSLIFRSIRVAISCLFRTLGISPRHLMM